MNNRTIVSGLFMIALVGTSSLPANEPEGTNEFCAADWPAQHATCRPVPLNGVEARGYLGKRIDRNPASILLALDSPIPKGFEAAVMGIKQPQYRLAADSDLYKWLEGACYVFARGKDPAIKQEIDRIAGLIVKCQEDDGYINTQPQKKRWDPAVKHDLYIAGHLFEAAVAHYRATGEKSLLNAACRWADYLISEYKKGNPYYTTTGLADGKDVDLKLVPWSVRANRSEDSRWLIFLPLASATRGGDSVMASHTMLKAPIIITRRDQG